MTEHEERLLGRVERCERRNAIASDYTLQGSFEKAMLHLGHPLPGGGRVLEPSDGGDGAARMYERVEEMPLWQKLWINAYADLPKNGKRVVQALMVDWRSRPAARIAGVSQPTVDSWKKTKLKVHFVQCLQAWKRDFGR